MGRFSVSRSVGGSTVFCGMLLSVLVLLKSSCVNLWVKDFRGIESIFSGLKRKNQELLMLASVPCIYQKHLIQLQISTSILLSSGRF